MRKKQKPYMFYMSEIEKGFVDLMAWKLKIPMAQYLKRLIHREMDANADVVREVEQRNEE